MPTYTLVQQDFITLRHFKFKVLRTYLKLIFVVSNIKRNQRTIIISKSFSQKSLRFFNYYLFEKKHNKNLASMLGRICTTCHFYLLKPKTKIL